MSFTIFQKKIIGSTIQLVTENLDVFNQASRGTILIGSGEVIKENVEKMTVGLIDGLVQDRNEHATIGTAVEPTVLTRLLGGSINSAGRIGPVAIHSGTMRLIESNVNKAAAEVATIASEAMIQHYIKVAVGSVGAATTQHGMGFYDQDAYITGHAGEMYPHLEDFPLAASVFGDQADVIKAWFMSGTQWAKFSAREAVKSAKLVFELGNMKVYSDGFGRAIVVSDAVTGALSGVKAGSAYPYYADSAVIGLVPGAVQVTTTETKMAASNILGRENIENWWQGEFNYGVAVKGSRPTAAFRQATEGVKTPTLDDLRTVDNWELEKGETDRKPSGNKADPKAPSRNVRETAGVIMRLTPSQVSAAVQSAGGE